MCCAPMRTSGALSAWGGMYSMSLSDLSLCCVCFMCLALSRPGVRRPALHTDETRTRHRDYTTDFEIHIKPYTQVDSLAAVVKLFSHLSRIRQVRERVLFSATLMVMLR